MKRTAPSKKKPATSKKRGAGASQRCPQPGSVGTAERNCAEAPCSVTPPAGMSMNTSSSDDAPKAKRKRVRKYSRARSIWHSMRTRCNNPNAMNYRWYGAKGIAVCERWGRLANFLADMGEPPEGHSIDRIKPEEGYHPGNCVWSPQPVQTQHNSRTRLTDLMVLEARARRESGESIKDIARDFGVWDTTLGYAIKGESWRA